MSGRADLALIPSEEEKVEGGCERGLRTGGTRICVFSVWSLTVAASTHFQLYLLFLSVWSPPLHPNRVSSQVWKSPLRLSSRVTRNEILKCDAGMNHLTK
ncbi:hypothetical protein XENOCAPTIV_024385 [Xenoophorus captivus]|uniref:Uncharacterized protein n=1 Tax=Xenoophorus captivus TaxID=1517983 RepID=A0ABV0S203_9TELE